MKLNPRVFIPILAIAAGVTFRQAALPHESAGKHGHSGYRANKTRGGKAAEI